MPPKPKPPAESAANPARPGPAGQTGQPGQSSSSIGVPESRLDTLSSAPRRLGANRGAPPLGPNVRAGSAPTGGLKFKPKMVARRTREERDASAPVCGRSELY
ncbi:uncharacterized protein V1510DRAFT_412173 [Dipodascopsis tothii]|uniref:uncharacterized protein n=1 Tax=Dipodascopsis tothii TaxID=44089 RepID=UPI0034CEF1B0